MPQNKYEYLIVLQQRTLAGWEDVYTVGKNDKDARKIIKGIERDYRNNQPQFSYRIINRRVEAA